MFDISADALQKRKTDNNFCKFSKAKCAKRTIRKQRENSYHKVDVGSYAERGI